jgi:hypothetical protein
MTPESQEKEDKAVLALVAKALRTECNDVTEAEIASVLGSGCKLSDEGRAALENLGPLDLDSRGGAVSEPMRSALLVSAIHRENTDAELDEATKEALSAKRKEVLDRILKRKQSPSS